MSFRFDNTVNLGHILIMLGVISAAFSGYMAIRINLDNHELRIKAIETFMLAQQETNKNLSNLLWDIKRDVAVIKDRSYEGRSQAPVRNRPR